MTLDVQSRLAFAAAVCTCTGCGILDFDIVQTMSAQTIRGSGIPAPLGDLFPFPLTIDLESEIEAKNTGPIDSVTLSSLELQITSSDSDWTFVTHIDVSVESARSASTLPEVKIASVSSLGAVRILTFDIEPGVNLKPYIDEGTQVNSRCTGTLPARDVTFEGKAVFTVHPL